MNNLPSRLNTWHSSRLARILPLLAENAEGKTQKRSEHSNTGISQHSTYNRPHPDRKTYHEAGTQTHMGDSLRSTSYYILYVASAYDEAGRLYATIEGSQRLPRQLRLLLFGATHAEVDIAGFL